MVPRSRFLPILSILVVLVICFPSLANTVHEVHAASLPDLTVDSIWLEKSSNPGQAVAQVAPGEQFLIVSSIKNVGSATASGYYLDVYYDSDYGRGGPDGIAPGEVQVWFVGSLTAQAGTHTTKWVVDPDNQIAEVDEGNNQREYTFTIGSETTNTTTTRNSTTSSTFSETVAPKAITSNGGASIDTSQNKFGGASGLFDGGNDYLSTPDSADWALGATFTIDFWARFNSIPTSGAGMNFLSQYQDINNYYMFDVFNDGSGYYRFTFFVVSGGSTIINGYAYCTITTGTWYHFAFVKSSTTWYLFQNGALFYEGSGADSDSVPDLAATLHIGGDSSITWRAFFNGWFDEFRISKGIARWTANFTPPTAPAFRDSQTVLLLHMDGTSGSTTFLDDVTVVTTTTTSSTTSTTSTFTTSSTSTTTSFPVTVSIIVTANPVGSIVVDGTTYTSTQTFAWVPGSSHTIAANSPVPGASGTQYVWTSWADGGDQSRTITAPSSPTTYTANYQTQYQVTYSQTGCSLPVSLPATEWVNAGGSVVGTFPPTVTSGDGKTQCVLQSASPTGPISAPTAFAGTYKTQYYLTVASSYGSPTGQGWYDAGSTATFAATSPASGGAGTQYVFTGWSSSDTGGYSGTDASHSVTVSNPVSETASWKTQWQVALAVNPSGGGAITVNGQPSATTWYDDDAVVSIQANSNTGYAFSSWSSDAASITFASSSSSSTNATIHGTGTITASLLLKDTTPPIITTVVTPSANGNGWNIGPVTVRWSVSDAESGIASSTGCTTTTLSTETPLAGTTLTCNVTDGAGLSNSASVTVKIDLTAPTLTLPSPTVEATGPSGATVSYDASASDSLSGLNTFSCIPPSGSTFPIATTTVSCSATDKAGNTASGAFAVTVQDKTAPVVTVPADMTVDGIGPGGAVVTFSSSSSDLVDGSVSTTCSPASGTTFVLGSTKVTCSATDKAGNSGFASFNVIVQDKTAPVVTVPADMTVEATGASGEVVTFSASASDLVDGPVQVTCTPASGTTFVLGSTKVTCSATDRAGNIESGSFNAVVEDKTPPVLTVLADMTVDATSKDGAVVTFTISALDAVDGSLTPTCTPSSGSTFALGSTQVTCSVTDKAGNSGSASFNVAVQDMTPPVVTVPADMTVDDTDPIGAVVTFTASASDLVDGPLIPTCTPASGSTFSVGTTKVSCSATDKAGNTGSASFNVIVQQKTPPVVTVPADMTVDATGPSGAVVTFFASALDAVDGSLTPTCTPPSGSTFAFGSTTVTCTATNKAGSTGSASFKVTVVDTTPPTLKLPSDMTVQATSPSGAVATFSASASDLVDGSVPVTCTPASGSTFPVGTTKVTCSATDKAGNSASGSFQVTVPPVTVKLLDSKNNGLSGGVVQYYSGGWKSFGITGSDGTASMALPPGTHTFQISYAGASQQKSQNVGTNPSVVFQTTLVTMKLLSSTNTELSGGAQYYASGWKAFGGGTTTTTMELLPLTYTFQISYAGASQQLSLNVASNPNVIFQTTLVTMKLLSSDGSAELTGTAQYYAGGWKTFGSGTTTATMELLPLTYTFQISFRGASQQKSQDVSKGANVKFQTTLVTMKLLSSTNTELSGGAQCYAGGWKTFGGGTTTTTMELLPLTYTFQVSYGGASQQKSQNVGANPNVVFQTVQVHSDSGKCTSYLAGSWRTFTQDMELLPGTYTFRFSDGTANTSYTIVAGAIMHIH